MPSLDPACQLTLILGDSPYLIDREARALVAAILPPEERAYGLTELDLEGTPLREVLESFRAGSLIATRRVLLLRNLQRLRAAPPKSKGTGASEEPRGPEEDESAEAVGAKRKPGDSQRGLLDAVSAMPAGLFVILTHVSTRFSQRTEYPVSAPLLKLVQERGQIASFTTPYERELAQWAIGEAGSLGKALEPQAAEALIEMTGRDHGRLAAEVGKLCVYVEPADRITLKDVRSVAVRSIEHTSFELVDAIAEGDARRALAILPDLVPAHGASSAAIPLLGMIARNLRLLWQASFLARNGLQVDRNPRIPETVAELLPTQQNITEATRSAFVARKLARHARSFTDSLAAASLERVLHADRTLKGQTGETLDAGLVMERLVAELCLLSLRAAGGQPAR